MILKEENFTFGFLSEISLDSQSINNSIYGLGYKLIVQRNNDSIAFYHCLVGDVNAAHTTMDGFGWYVPHSTPNFAQSTLQ